jgi:hypothetical protein
MQEPGSVNDPLLPQRPSEHYLSLIVRIWWKEKESRDADDDWRSEVEHIQSTERWNFSSLGDLEGFLEKFLNQAV